MHFSRKSFDRLVEAAIAALPPDFAQWLDEVPVIVEDRPAQADLQGLAKEPDEGDPLGMYIGISKVEGDSLLPPRVMLYRIPLMEACDSREQLAEEIRKTLLHELGHHAGLDEEDLDRLGYGPLDEGEEEIEFDVDDPD